MKHHVFRPDQLRQRLPHAAWRDRLCAEVLLPCEIEILREWGLLRFQDGAPAWPGRGTLQCLWLDCEPHIVKDAAEAQFDRWRHVRASLCADTPATDAVLRKVIEFAGGKKATTGLATRLLGNKAVLGAGKRLRRLQGGGRKATPTLSSGTFKQLLKIFPPGYRAPLRAAMARPVLPKIVEPESSHIGRVLAIKGDAARLLAATMLLKTSVERRSMASAFYYLSRIERFDAITYGRDQRSAAAVGHALESYVAGILLPDDGERARLQAARRQGNDVRAAAKFLSAHVKAKAATAVSLLPATHPDEAVFVTPLKERLDKIGGDKREVQVERITSFVPMLLGMLVACENRVHQLEGIAEEFLKRLPDARVELAAGRTAGLAWRGPVVRPDGSLGPGEQIVSLDLVREDRLVADARILRPDDAGLLRLQKRIAREPARAAQVHLAYVGVAPVQSGGECHEPWLIDQLRWGVFSGGKDLTQAASRRRRSMMLSMEISLGYRVPAGFLEFGHATRNTMRECRRADPDGCRVCVPVVEWLHAMLCARVVLRMSVRWGARIAETMQLRLGCFNEESVDGDQRLTASLKPKNWKGLALFELDAGTIGAITQVKEFGHARFSSDCFDDDGDTSLPVVPFSQSARRDLPPARYILRGRDGALRSSHLLVFLRSLLCGVVNMRSHEGRYLFATALGMRGSGYREIGGALHHSPGSRLPRHYDLSRLVAMWEETGSFNAYLDAQTIGTAANG